MPRSTYIDSEQRLLNPFARGVEPAVGDKAIGALGQVKRVDVETRTVSAVMSTNALDRHGEMIEPRAFEGHLQRFMQNPVLLADHDHTRQVGHWRNVRITSRGLEGDAVFAETPDADQLFALYRDGHRKAFSVGFIVHAYEMRDLRAGDGEPRRTRVFTEVELLECSAVAVPANPDALVASLKRDNRAGGGGIVSKGEQLGQRIREAREAAELTIAEVAADLPITASTLQQIEAGSIIRPPDEVLRAIAGALDLSFDELQQLADDDAEGQGSGEGGGTEGDDRSLSNRKARAMIHREVKPVVRQVIREELAKAIDDLGLGKLAGAAEIAGGDSSRSGRSRSAEGRGGAAPADPKHFWDEAFAIDDAADDAAALEELAEAFAGD